MTHPRIGGKLKGGGSKEVAHRKKAPCQLLSTLHTWRASLGLRGLVPAFVQECPCPEGQRHWVEEALVIRTGCLLMRTASSHEEDFHCTAFFWLQFVQPTLLCFGEPRLQRPLIAKVTQRNSAHLQPAWLTAPENINDDNPFANEERHFSLTTWGGRPRAEQKSRMQTGRPCGCCCSHHFLAPSRGGLAEAVSRGACRRSRGKSLQSFLIPTPPRVFSRL